MKNKLFWIIALVATMVFAFVNCGNNENTTTYTVTFDSKDGSPVTQIKNVKNGSTITEPAKPTKTDYSFIGWYKEEALTNKWDFSKDTVTADITLYAKWQLIEVPKPRQTTINLFNNMITASVEGVLFDADWSGAAFKVETAINAAYNEAISQFDMAAAGALGNVFDNNDIVIILEKNPVGYINYKIVAGEYKTLYLNVDSALSVTDITKAVTAMYDANGTNLIGKAASEKKGNMC